MWSRCWCWCCGVWVDVEHVLVLGLWVGPPAVCLLKAPGSPCVVEAVGVGVGSLPSCLCWCLQAPPGSVSDRTMCVGAPEEHSWKQIICRRTCVNIEGVLSTPEMNCCGKGSLVSFPKAWNSSPALLFFSGLLTEQMLAWLSLLHQPHPSVRRSSRQKPWKSIHHGCLVTLPSFTCVVAALW